MGVRKTTRLTSLAGSSSSAPSTPVKGPSTLSSNLHVGAAIGESVGDLREDETTRLRAVHSRFLTHEALLAAESTILARIGMPSTCLKSTFTSLQLLLFYPIKHLDHSKLCVQSEHHLRFASALLPRAREPDTAHSSNLVPGFLVGDSNVQTHIRWLKAVFVLGATAEFTATTFAHDHYHSNTFIDDFLV